MKDSQTTAPIKCDNCDAVHPHCACGKVAYRQRNEETKTTKKEHIVVFSPPVIYCTSDDDAARLVRSLKNLGIMAEAKILSDKEYNQMHGAFE